MRLIIALMLVAAVAEASPKCPSPRVHTHASVADAKASLGSVPPQAAPELVGRGAAFFVDVPIGSPNGSDAVSYKVAAIFIRDDHSVVVVDDLARWTSVIPPPGHSSPTTPAKSLRVAGAIAHLEIAGALASRVDVARAMFLGCGKP